jgi:hypothetical protein
MINQLFREKPTIDLASNIVKYFGLKNLHDPSFFSRSDMRSKKTVEKIREHLLAELKKIYIKCKAKSYLTDLDEKAVLTVLRQILRVHDFQLVSRSKCIKGLRYQQYRILTM